MYATSRNVGMGKQESELLISIRKAINSDETAPKRKHVRACILFTWDHKSSSSFWQGMKIQPILADEVQTYKALITIHKVLQEGHPVVLKEAQQHISWLDSLKGGAGSLPDSFRGYGQLIHEYVNFLQAKLMFHRQHSEFNGDMVKVDVELIKSLGTFEYEEYISLKSINDPNEGYETITDLMGLQDQIDVFQKMIFAHFRSGTNNECRISSLVPLVLESYGIYKFISSMLRALYSSIGDDTALEPLHTRFDAQHHRLVRFYYECSNLRYLTSLIAVPKLSTEAPNLRCTEEEKTGGGSIQSKSVEKPGSPALPIVAEPEPIAEFWENEQLRQQEMFENEQRRLREQWEAQRIAQEQTALHAQREFEEQQRHQLEQQQLAQERLLRQQLEQQTQGRIAELEQENLKARAHFEQDQLLLEQYDRRVKALETDIQQVNANFGQQIRIKDEQIAAFQEQVNTWRNKYEALAKLYTQLRNEHIALLEKYKTASLKAASAQEAVEKREKVERELKSKNMELADLIRERDRAISDKERIEGYLKEEIDKLSRDVRLAEAALEKAEKDSVKEREIVEEKFRQEIRQIEGVLEGKSRGLRELEDKLEHTRESLERQLREKEDELDIFKAGMDQTLVELTELKQGRIKLEDGEDKEREGRNDKQEDIWYEKIQKIVDGVLQASVVRVDEALYQLESTMQGGNQNATGEYVLSQIEKAGQSAMEFSSCMNDYIADGVHAEIEEIIRTANGLAGSIEEVLINSKGLLRLAWDEKATDGLTNGAKSVGMGAICFFRGVMSYRLANIEELEHRTEVVIYNNLEVQGKLRELSKSVETYTKKSGLIKESDLEAMVAGELGKAAEAIEKAGERLEKLRQRGEKNEGNFSTYELKIHKSILEAALMITNAISRLIKAAGESQAEIVREGRGTSSNAAFYKKHNRWTEGLISAAKAVANSTNIIIETADGVISGRGVSFERLIVASNEVSASTAQLVAASRVKARLMSKTQETLEIASKAVTSACKELVKRVRDIIAAKGLSLPEDMKPEDYGKLSNHEFKTREMEQQVEILRLENELTAARIRLGEMRKISYREV